MNYVVPFSVTAFITYREEAVFYFVILSEAKNLAYLELA